MKILVKINKVEDNTVYYAEISRKTGEVMIEDYMGVEQFGKALEMENFGFELVKMTKQQAIRCASMFGAVITNWYYTRGVMGFEASVSCQEYDNGYGHMHSTVGIRAWSQAGLCAEAITGHLFFNGNN
ncbi:hypothetical protein [Vibrio sp. WXL210]|uniref:hypothetical protein n=1 Tax=Vibrio sp. WXL210 TaxID=3450709 RepID=UPI003EC5006C